MSKEEVAQIAFGLIVHAGDAKSQAQQAINAANHGDFEKSDDLLHQALKELKQAHEIQTRIVQAESAGTHYEVTVLLVHAQDHFAMAMSAIDVAREMIKMNKRIMELEKKLGGNV